MTNAEFKAYYHLKKIDEKAFVKGIRNLREFNLDDYNEEDNSSSNGNIGALLAFDHTKHMMPVRQQGQCGSCWAFSIHAVIEGNWNKRNPLKRLDDHQSTQQSVDCDPNNNGCDGGWFSGAFTFLKGRSGIKDASYPYNSGESGYAEDCKSIGVANGVIITGYSFYQPGMSLSTFETMVQNGPTSVAVDANTWSDYESGIFTPGCTVDVNHAVTLVGYAPVSATNTVAYWVVRNSWGADWGEAGHIRIKSDGKKSCQLETYAYQPKF